MKKSTIRHKVQTISSFTNCIIGNPLNYENIDDITTKYAKLIITLLKENNVVRCTKNSENSFFFYVNNVLYKNHKEVEEICQRQKH